MEFSDDPAIQFQYMQKFKKETQTNAVHICSEECYSQEPNGWNTPKFTN